MSARATLAERGASNATSSPAARCTRSASDRPASSEPKSAVAANTPVATIVAFR